MRFSFLVRFALLTAVLSIGTAVVLSAALSRYQERVFEQQVVAESLGRISAMVTPAMETAESGRTSGGTLSAHLAKDAQQLTSFEEYTRGLRLYYPDGSALFPRGASADAAEVRAALHSADFVRGPVRIVNGERIFTAYSPFADVKGNGVAAVIAVDFSLDQMAAQNAREGNFVFLLAWGACTVIFISLLALALAAQRELNRRERLAEQTFNQAMTGIASIVDKRDPYTAGHSVRVAQYAVRIARRMRLPREQISSIERAALLHDIGKIGIPDAILLKPAALDNVERSIIVRHPDIANEILCGVEAMADIVPCIVHHHERWDGNGYPGKLQGLDIPLGARIIAAADTFDAMTTDRPYRRALSAELAREELLRGAGTQWDAACVEALVALIDANEVTPPVPSSDVASLARSFGRQTPVAGGD